MEKNGKERGEHRLSTILRLDIAPGKNANVEAMQLSGANKTPDDLICLGKFYIKKVNARREYLFLQE